MPHNMTRINTYALPDHGATCEDTRDCTFIWAYCDIEDGTGHGTCKCEHEHKYDPVSDECVKECAVYGVDFTYYNNWNVGHFCKITNDVRVYVVTALLSVMKSS